MKLRSRLRDFVSRASGGRLPPPPPAVAVLRLEGVIAPASRFGTLSLARLEAALERAFEVDRLAAVALVINSPGGSPAQSSLIHARIRALAERRKIPVYAFAEDLAASGGYWLALAADEIWAQEGSLVGSIGVITAGFGFARLIDRLGIERRVHTAGTSKGMLDPFRPEDAEDIDRLKAIQADLHDAFRTIVRTRRGDRLQEDAETFSGAVFTGRQALSNGLIDGIGAVEEVLRQRFGDKTRFRAIEIDRRRWLPRLLGRSQRPGFAARAIDDILARLEERSLWSGYGL